MGEVYRFGEWLVEPDLNRLSRGADSQHIEPLAMDVLVHLLTHRDRVVAIDEVLDQVWPDRHGDPGMVKKRVGQIRRALGDDSRHPTYVETIPKRGYRIIAPVSSVDPGAQSRGSGDAAAGPRPGRVVRAAALLGTVVVGTLLAAWWIRTAPEAAPDRLRLAVEPFTYAVDEPRLEGYAALLGDELTDHLARLARPDMDLVESANDAGFVVMGSMTPLADGTRLFIRVIDTGSGIVMWSKGLTLPAEPSDELIATRPEQLATLVYQVVSVSTFASGLTESPDAVRELIAGMLETSEMWQGFGGDWNAALAHFTRASELDPEFILAPTFLANLYVNRMGRTLRYEAAAGPAHAYTRRVLELDERWTWLAGWVATHDLDYEAAAANYEHARRAGHPAPLLEFSLGLLALIQGQLDDAIARFDTTLEMGAMDNRAMAHTLIAHAHFTAGRFDAARDAAATAVAATRGTGAYAHLLALTIKAYADYFCGDAAGARRSLQAAWAQYGGTHPQAFAGLHALLGDADVAWAILEDGERRWAQGKGGLLSPYFWGYYHLGEIDRAFVWLTRAIEDREVGFLAALRRSPLLEPIRSDPRFAAAMARLADIERTGTPITSVAYPGVPSSDS